ncbi:tubulin folding cofactor b, partial [Nannochloropsis oceanica]
MHPGVAPPRRLHQDAQALRDYLVAGDAVRYDLLPKGVVMVSVTHSNLGMSMPDIRLDLHTSIDGVKEKLYTHCGTKPQHQRLFLKRDSGDSTMLPLSDDSKKLGYYSVESGMCIHVVDDVRPSFPP